MAENRIQFFSAVDVNPKTGKIVSEYPGWWHERNIDEMQHTVSQTKLRLLHNRVPADKIAQTEITLKQEEARLDELKNSKPKLSDKQRDEFYQGTKELGNKISELMPTRDQISRHMVDAHEEARKVTTPCIDIKSLPKGAEMAYACNVPISAGKVTRDGAVKIMHIVRKVLGERFFIESLRRA